MDPEKHQVNISVLKTKFLICVVIEYFHAVINEYDNMETILYCIMRFTKYAAVASFIRSVLIFKISVLPKIQRIQLTCRILASSFGSPSDNLLNLSLVKSDQPNLFTLCDDNCR